MLEVQGLGHGMGVVRVGRRDSGGGGGGTGENPEMGRGMI